jgi:hypothetical protein
MMSNELSIATGRTGQTIIAKLFAGATQQGTAINLTELSGQGGFYLGSVPGGTPAGHYDVLFVSAGALVGEGVLDWDGSAEVTPFAILQKINTITGGTTGANPVTVTVQDANSNPIQAAIVSLWLNGQVVATTTTNASGVASTSANNAAYTLTITAAGFNALNQSVTISGTYTATKQLSALATPTNSASGVTGYAYTYGPNGTTIEPGVTVEYQMAALQPGDTGIVDPSTQTAISDNTGLVNLTGLRPYARYRVRSSRSTKWQTIEAQAVNFTFGIVG